MSKRIAFLCGTPRESCTGHSYITDQHLPPRCHDSSVEAFKCHVRWLKGQGYTPIGAREFRPPDGGRVLVLPKKSKFGGMLRQGKSVDGKSKRYMPHGQHTRGVVF